MRGEPLPSLEQAAGMRNEDGTFGYIIQIDDHAAGPIGRYETQHEAWAAGMAEMQRIKAERGLAGKLIPEEGLKGMTLLEFMVATRR
jgi:hypothetical protein